MWRNICFRCRNWLPHILHWCSLACLVSRWFIFSATLPNERKHIRQMVFMPRHLIECSISCFFVVVPKLQLSHLYCVSVLCIAIMCSWQCLASPNFCSQNLHLCWYFFFDWCSRRRCTYSNSPARKLNGQSVHLKGFSGPQWASCNFHLYLLINLPQHGHAIESKACWPRICSLHSILLAHNKRHK